MNKEYREKLSHDVRRIAFIEVDRFDQLFEDWKVHEPGGDGFPWIRIDPEGSTESYIGDLCEGHSSPLEGSLRVKPKPEVVRWISQNMIAVDHDAIRFCLIGRIDGLLVVARSGKILAQQWLALLPSSEIASIQARLEESQE